MCDSDNRITMEQTSWQQMMSQWPQNAYHYMEDLPLPVGFRFRPGDTERELQSFQEYVRKDQRFSRSQARELTAGGHVYTNWQLEATQAGCRHEKCDCTFALTGHLAPFEKVWFQTEAGTIRDQFYQIAMFLEKLELVEEQPRVPYALLHWEEVGLISQVGFEQWTDDLPAKKYLEQLGQTGSVVFWQGQRIDDLQMECLHALREKGDVVILTLEGSRVVALQGPLVTLLENHPVLFNSSQLQSCRLKAGLGMGRPRQLAPVYLPEKRREEFIHLRAEGPHAGDVKVVRGLLTTISYTVQDGLVIWHFCSKADGQVALDVPIEIKAMWLQMQYKAAHEQNFLSQAYYAQSLESYSLWSLPLHGKQVAQVLAVLPPTAHVVVPGDGLGVVARQWAGQMTVGDAYVTKHSHPQIRRESFMDTMVRGQKAGRVLILSYVYSLMSADERHMVEMWDGPVFIIDVKDSSPLSHLLHLGPGVFGSMPGIRSTPFTVVEKNTAMHTVQFSENLLRFPSIRTKTMSPSVLYWRGMRPYGDWTDPEGQLVVHDLQEYVALLSKGEDLTGMYLASIGKVLEGVDEVSFDVAVSLQVREVYAVHLSHGMADLVRQRCQYAEYQGRLLFTVLATAKWHFTKVSPVHKEKNFVKMGEETPMPYVLCGHHDQNVVVQTPSGTKMWSLQTSYHRWLLVTYFSCWGGDGWRGLLTSDSKLRSEEEAYVGVVPQGVPFSLHEYHPSLEMSPLFWEHKEKRKTVASQIQWMCTGNSAKRKEKMQKLKQGMRFGDAMDLPPPEFW